MTRLTLNGVDLTYLESGQGEPLILLHGTVSDRFGFDRLRAELGDGIRAISYDQRDSYDAPFATSYGMLDHAHDCAALIGALGLERAHICGASYGGAIAMMTAIHHPEVVHSLILTSTLPAWSMTGPLAAEGARISREDPAAMDGYLIGALFSRDVDSAIIDDFRASAKNRVLGDESRARRMAALAGHDCRDQLARIDAPTLVLHGSDDLLIPVTTAEWTTEHIPGAKLHLLEGAAHGLSSEFAARAADVVRDFVFSHPLAGARPSGAADQV